MLILSRHGVDGCPKKEHTIVDELTTMRRLRSSEETKSNTYLRVLQLAKTQSRKNWSSTGPCVRLGAYLVPEFISCTGLWNREAIEISYYMLSEMCSK